MNGGVGTHENAELGRFIITAPKTKKDSYRLDTGVYKTRLGLQTRPDGLETLVMLDALLGGISLETGSGGSALRLV